MKTFAGALLALMLCTNMSYSDWVAHPGVHFSENQLAAKVAFKKRTIPDFHVSEAVS